MMSAVGHYLGILKCTLIINSGSRSTATVRKLCHNFSLRVSPFKFNNNSQPNFDLRCCSTSSLASNEAIKLTEKQKKLIQMEYELWKYSKSRIPNELTEVHWGELYSLPGPSARLKYLNYIFRIEKQKENRKEKQIQKAEKREETKRQVAEKKLNNKHILYNVGGNSLYYVLRNASIDRFNNMKLIRAMQLSQPLVIDMGYDAHMNSHEKKNCAEQLMLLFANNRVHEDPYNLYFCNMRRGSDTTKHFEKFLPPLFSETFPINTSEKSYLDIFPKDKLVYLSPDARTDLVWDYDAIYIIGALVDKGSCEPLSLAKAKREGIKVARLPFDQYIQWGTGSGKRLTLDVMVKILLEVNATGDWLEAFKHIPPRKLIKNKPNPPRYYKRRF